MVIVRYHTIHLFEGGYYEKVNFDSTNADTICRFGFHRMQ
jgi:hypothetical protein